MSDERNKRAVCFATRVYEQDYYEQLKFWLCPKCVSFRAMEEEICCGCDTIKTRPCDIEDYIKVFGE